MHVMKIFGTVVGSLWAYSFIGVFVARGILVEFKGMMAWEDKLIAMFIWPILPVVFVVSKEL